MKNQIIIEYDVVNDTIQIVKNELTTFESIAVLEVAKTIVSQDLERIDGE